MAIYLQRFMSAWVTGERGKLSRKRVITFDAYVGVDAAAL